MASSGKTVASLTQHQLIGEPDRRRVLIVDDEASLRDMLGRFLRSRGYVVHAAADAGAALRELRSQQYALLLTDVRLPDTFGVELVDAALTHDPDLAVILLTGFPDDALMNAAYQRGAMDYLTKPVPLENLEQSIERALAQRALTRERRQLESFIEREVAKETAAFSRERDSRTTAIAETLGRLCAMHEESFDFLRGTSVRVATVAGVIAQEFALPAAVVDDIRTAARVRDIGLVAVPADLLKRPGPLGAEEFNRIKQHVRLAVELLAPLGFRHEVIACVHTHHEHWDGSGYPRRLFGESIPFGGRILCGAETFVALLSPRPFRAAMSTNETLDYLGGLVGGLLDPAVYEALVRAVRESHILGLGT